MLFHQIKPRQLYNVQEYFASRSILEKWHARKRSLKYIYRMQHNMQVLVFLSFVLVLGHSYLVLVPREPIYVNLPKAKTARAYKIPKTCPHIFYDRSGNIVLNSRFETYESLGEHLAPYTEKTERVYLSIDSQLGMVHVNALLSVIKDSGFTRITFLTK